MRVASDLHRVIADHDLEHRPSTNFFQDDSDSEEVDADDDIVG